jgi:hypothetical protein
MTARLRLVTAAAVLLALLPAPAARAQAPVAGPLPGIAVTGRAAVAAPNDTAAFRFTVSRRRATARAAVRATSTTVARVVAALRARGVRPGDLQTEALGVRREPRRDRRTGRRRTTFVASTTVRAAIRPVARAGALVDAAVAAGATGVDGPELTLSDPEAVYRRALGAALANARAKAEQLAAQAGVALGPPVQVVEGGDLVPAAAGDEGAGGGSAVGVRGGRTEVVATLVVTFAIG